MIFTHMNFKNKGNSSGSNKAQKSAIDGYTQEEE